MPPCINIEPKVALSVIKGLVVGRNGATDTWAPKLDDNPRQGNQNFNGLTSPITQLQGKDNSESACKQVLGFTPIVLKLDHWIRFDRSYSQAGPACLIQLDQKLIKTDSTKLLDWVWDESEFWVLKHCHNQEMWPLPCRVQ